MPTPSGSSILSRSVHAVLAIATGVGASLLLFVLLVSLGTAGVVSDEAIEPLMTALWFVPFLIGALIIWRRVSYRLLLPVLGPIVCGLGYLAWDDFNRSPAPEVGAVIAADDTGYQVYRWMLKGDPHSRLAELSPELERLPRFPAQPAGWPAFLTEHREQFESAWAQDTLGRSWIETLATKNTSAIFPPGTPESPILAFTPLRNSVQLRWAHAGLLALDDREDEAAQVLLTLLRATHQLKRSGMNMLTQMIAIVFLKGTQERLRLLAETGKLSETTRAELLSVLENAPPISLTFKNMFQGEQIFARATFENTVGMMKQSMPPGMFGVSFDPAALHPLIYNPKRTEREYAQMLDAQRSAAMQRTMSEQTARAQKADEEMKTWHFKNPVGRSLQAMALPAFAKVSEQVWLAEDQRLALIQQLRARH